ncbi:MAG TPA: Lpp/OprI family alanine-zipper lipoprotein [Myxococcota bacterium]|nr:Lpp/OprI family alanine-zipper lipoprotein [Myxococcota bacterium]
MSRWGEKRVVSVALTALLLGVGCATNGDVSAARAEAEQARRIAEDANAKASAAAADAAAARAAAERAAQDAREANEKADRIFQRSLHK